MRSYILSILYPVRCPGCGEIIHPEEKFCDDCKAQFSFIKIRQHKNKNNRFDSLVSVFYYKDTAKRMMLRYKFHGKKNIHKIMSEYMLKEFEENYASINFDYITYVPMSVTEYMERGFNQTKLLAKDISEKTEIKCERLLRKMRKTEHQMNLSAKERALNLKDCFKPTKKIKGKTVLLVDDIKTTGTTLNECSKVLRKAGAKEIYCITFAIADEHRINA